MILQPHARSSDHWARTSFRLRSAFSLVELVVVMAIVSITVSILGRTLAASAKLDPVAEETAIAAEGARCQIEEMRSHPFAEIFKRYNASHADDPDGPGTAPGNHFTVGNLAPPTADGFVGTVTFPEVESELRENFVDDALTMPRDLNGDGIVDTQNHSADALVLPVRIRVEWAARTGHNNKRSLVVYTMFSKS